MLRVQKISLLVLFLLIGQFLSAQVKHQDVDSFQKGLQQEGVQIFDVRTAKEFNSGHIKGALQADYLKLEEFRERAKYLDKNKPVYVYCLGGGRSAKAAAWLTENGFTNVVDLNGGISAWKQAGKPVTGNTVNEKQMSISSFTTGLNKNKLTLVDVGAAWCPPCRKMKPLVDDWLKKHPDVSLLNVDGGKDIDVMKSIDATVLPTFVLYKNGKEIWRKSGIFEMKELDKIISTKE